MSLPGKRPDMRLHTPDPVNAEPPAAALVDADITPIRSFYVRNHGPIPPETPSSEWLLRVEGLVREPLELSVAALRQRFTAQEVVATLQCAGNRRTGLLAVRDIPGEAPWGPGATGTAAWRGARLRDVLAAAGIAGDAQHVELEGDDVSDEASPPQPFAVSIPRHKALAPEVLLAWEMNAEPLPLLHGGPLRAVVPGYIGARSVKWLRRIVARRDPSPRFFQAHAYRLLPADSDPAHAGAGVSLGAIAVNCAILSPPQDAEVAAGEVELRGYAFAGDDRRIVRVDVSCDAGRDWSQAELLRQPSPWTWRRWVARVELRAGRHEIAARAWDSAAATQPEDPAMLWNPKGYVNNAWSRLSLTVR